MIGLDTNIVVRFLTQDDPRLSPTASRIMRQDLSRERPGFISLVVAAEIAWVLETLYRVDRRDAAAAIEGLAAQDGLVFQQVEDVLAATAAVQSTRLDFGDALIAALGRTAGCSTTLTFDVAAARAQGFTLAR